MMMGVLSFYIQQWRRGKPEPLHKIFLGHKRSPFEFDFHFMFSAPLNLCSNSLLCGNVECGDNSAVDDVDGKWAEGYISFGVINITNEMQ